MNTFNDLYMLITKLANCFLEKDVLRELPLALHDMVVGATPQPKKPGYVYTDLHAHLYENTPIRDLLRVVSPRTDVLAIVTRTQEINAGHLSFEQVVQKLEQERIEHQRLGTRVAVVDNEGKPFYFVCGTKVYARENQGIIIVGNNREYPAGYILPLEELVKEAKDMGTFWYFDHYFSIFVPGIVFRYPTDKEIKQREEWADRYQPVIETGNLQNTLYMFPANILAKRFARKHGLVGLANSETHFNINELGLSRTAFPNELLDGRSEETFLSSLRSAYTPKHKDELIVESHYASIWNFMWYMAIPTLLRRYGTKKEALDGIKNIRQPGPSQARRE